MNTKQIDYILELSETKNFKIASDNLFISQPTLTYQIKLIEEEIGFKLFTRSSKGTVLTPAGEQFIVTLKDIRNQLKRAIEQGQNFSSAYSENIRIGMPTRSCLYLLPEVMKVYALEYPSVSITPYFDLYHGLDTFLKGDLDIIFENADSVNHIPDTISTPIYTTHFYFVCNNDDAYANKTIIKEEDLKDRTLLVNGGSSKVLRKIQQRVIQNTGCKYFNSNDHDTSLTYIASNRAIVIAPGSLNDHTNAFTWIPFDCEECLHYVLLTHSSDTRWSLHRLLQLLTEAYSKTSLPL